MTNKEFKQHVKNVRVGPKRGVTLAEITDIADPHYFMAGLVDFGNWPQLWEQVEIEALPGDRKMILILNAFYLEVSSGGLAQFVAAPVAGAFFFDVVKWCELIGAKATHRTLLDFLAMLPGKLVPVAEASRHDILTTLRTGGLREELRQLNMESRESLVDLIGQIRSHVRLHMNRFSQSLLFKPELKQTHQP